MATIIDFSRERALRPVHSARGQLKPEILIFPGVRYERATHSETADLATPEQRKRDHLLIPD